MSCPRGLPRGSQQLVPQLLTLSKGKKKGNRIIISFIVLPPPPHKIYLTQWVFGKCPKFLRSLLSVKVLLGSSLKSKTGKEARTCVQDKQPDRKASWGLMLMGGAAEPHRSVSALISSSQEATGGQQHALPPLQAASLACLERKWTLVWMPKCGVLCTQKTTWEQNKAATRSTIIRFYF